jgi:hypothetical protein
MLDTPTDAGTSAGAEGLEKPSNGIDPNPAPANNHEQVASTLGRISAQIKALEKSSIQNTAEIGRLLHEAEQQCAHGEYMKWLRSEFGWSHDSCGASSRCCKTWATTIAASAKPAR